MDKLGERLIADRARVEEMREKAERLEREARDLRRGAAEIERLAELARGQ